MERAVRTSGAECAVLRVEGDGVDRVDICHVVLRRVAVAFEREVRAIDSQLVSLLRHGKVGTHAASFSSTY
jgi:hypothetical protein